MAKELILGKSFTASNSLNLLLVVVQIAAALGFYGSPAIIYRFAVKEKGIDRLKALKLNLIWTAAFLIFLIGAIMIFGLSFLTVPAVLLWFLLSYKTLIYSPESGEKTYFIIRLFDKYQEIVIYIIVGVFATVVSWGVFFILSKLLDSENSLLLTLNTLLNWCAGVLVAYPMNRSWVFKSKSSNKGKEFINFVLSRIGTLIIEALLMPLLVNVLGIDQYVAKYAIASVVVIVLNYVFSKLFVFRKAK